MRVTFVGSHLFEPYHYSIIGILKQMKDQIDMRIFAKHPMPHPESGTEAPLPLIIPKDGIWFPDTDIVHAIGGGETAIKLANILDNKIPMVVSFVGGVDISRQLRLKHLSSGYKRLFKRANIITCTDRFGFFQLKSFGALVSKIVIVPAALPRHSYEVAQPKGDAVAIMAGRSIERKNHLRAVEIFKFSKYLKELIIIGRTDLHIDLNKKIIQLNSIPHKELLKLLSKSNVLLQTSNWKGKEFDTIPTIVIESLAMGIPVVSTPLFGIVELSRIFPKTIHVAKSASKLGEKVDQILINDIKKESLEVRHWILKHHSLKQITQKILDIYKEILL